MRLFFPLAASLLALCQFPAAWAQVYQWKDGSGRTVISDTPPPAAAKDRRTLVDQPLAPAAAPKTAAEKDMEFRKRQQESREKTEKAGKEQAAAAERKEYCDRARRQLAALESGEALVAWNDQGERRTVDANERQQEIERTRKAFAETCR